MSRWTPLTKKQAIEQLNGGNSIEQIAVNFNMSKSSVILLKTKVNNYEERVKCCICKNEFKQITGRHLKTHNITIEDYINKFPDAKICTDKRKKYYKDFKSPHKGKTYDEIYGIKESLIKREKISRKQVGRKCPLKAGTGIAGTRKDTNTFARSTYEANIDRIFMYHSKKYLDELSIEKNRFILKRKNGEKITYCPDRKDLDGLFCKDAYLEIKGYMYPEGWEKICLFREQYADLLLVICPDTKYCDLNYLELEKEYINKINFWESDVRNYKTCPEIYKIGYIEPSVVTFLKQNYPNHIHCSIQDDHKISIAKKFISYCHSSLGKNPYVDYVELIKISDRRTINSKKSSGKYNYELWEILTKDNEKFYVSNQSKTMDFYCYREDKIDKLLNFFVDNNNLSLKWGRKIDSSFVNIDPLLLKNANEHEIKILSMIEDRIYHKGLNLMVTDILKTKQKKRKKGSFFDFEEWDVYCNGNRNPQYKLNNFKRGCRFSLYNINKGA